MTSRPSRLKKIRRWTANFVAFWVEVVEHFVNNQCPQLAAALAYYALFSIPPLLLIIAMSVGSFLDPQDLERVLRGSVSAALPARFAERAMEFTVRTRTFAEEGPWWSVVLSFLGVMFGAMRGFVQLQTALNRAWSISEHSDRSTIADFLTKRFISFVSVIGVILLVIGWSASSAVIARFGSVLGSFASEGIHKSLQSGIPTILALVPLTAVVAAMYRFLPDAKIRWKDVLPGAIVAVVGLELLRSVLTYYLNQLELSDIYGQAASLASILVWLYAAANVFFFGAEVARVWSTSDGSSVTPERGARLSQEAAPAELAPQVRRWVAREA